MQIRKNRCDVAEPRFLCDHSSKSILDTLKASQLSYKIIDFYVINFVDEQVIMTTMENWIIERGSNNRT